MAAGARIVVAIDESPCSRRALDWALEHLHTEGSHWDVVTVMQPLNTTVYPMAPIATAAAINAVAAGWEAQRKHEQAHAVELLKQAVEDCVRHHNVRGGRCAGTPRPRAMHASSPPTHPIHTCAHAQVPKAQMQAHALPAAGGASGARHLTACDAGWRAGGLLLPALPA
jgi:hypothetical protein